MLPASMCEEDGREGRPERGEHPHVPSVARTEWAAVSAVVSSPEEAVQDAICAPQAIPDRYEYRTAHTF